MAWADCQAYMTAIHNLRAELSRELDEVQQNHVPRKDTLTALTEFRDAREKYWSSIIKEKHLNET